MRARAHDGFIPIKSRNGGSRGIYNHANRIRGLRNEFESTIGSLEAFNTVARRTV